MTEEELTEAAWEIFSINGLNAEAAQVHCIRSAESYSRAGDGRREAFWRELSIRVTEFTPPARKAS